MSTTTTKLTCVRMAHRPGETYEQFVEARKQGFGGSDVGDLLDAGPYGCKRRLFLDRLGLLPDRSEKFKHHLERGRFFESPVAKLYADKTGREVIQTGTGYIKEYPFIRANADRLVINLGRGGIMGELDKGVLEIKCPAAWAFKKIKQEGLPESYILQIQWQMLCYGTSWGSFVVYWPDGHELLWFDIERDEDMCSMLLDRGMREWRWLEVFQELRPEKKTHENLFIDSAFPGKHEPAHTACARCPAFEACHAISIPEGVILQNDDLTPAAETYVRLTAQIKELEEAKDDLKQSLKDEFAKFPAEQIRAGGYAITVREQIRNSLDTDRLKKELLTPAQVVLYTKQSKYETLTVKPVKE